MAWTVRTTLKNGWNSAYPGEHDLYPRDLGCDAGRSSDWRRRGPGHRDLPGFSPQRSAFIVANDIKYKITLQPQPQDLPELAEAAQQFWDTVTQSIVFFRRRTPARW